MRNPLSDLRIQFLKLAGLAVLVPLLQGCPPEDFPNAIDALQPEVDEIINDPVNTPQERREALAALGLSPATINGLLQSERTGNQFGGTLRSAYAKVTEPAFAELTPDEVQLYADAVAEADSTVAYSLSDVQAQEVQSAFVANALNSPADVEAFLSDPTKDVPGSTTVAVLQDVFVDFDPEEVVDQIP